MTVQSNSASGPYLIPRTMTEVIIMTAMISLVFVEWIPSPTSISSAVFACAVISLMACWAASVIVSRRIKVVEILILIYAFLIATNFLFVPFHNLQFEVWLRSAIPAAIFLITMPMLRFGGRADGEFLVRLLVTSSILWGIVNSYEFIGSFSLIIAGGQRITGLNQNFTIPFPLLGAIILLHNKVFASLVRFSLIVWFSLLVVLTGYKAHIAILIINLLIWLWWNRGTSVSILTVCVTVLSGFILAMNPGFHPVEYIVQRFSSIGGAGDQVRLFEISEALKIFAESPVFGAGLGVAFPVDMYMEQTKTYIHNSVFYYLATMGAIGLISITILLAVGLYRSRRVSNNLIFLSLVVTTLTSASYKLIHFVVMLAAVYVLLLIQPADEEGM